MLPLETQALIRFIYGILVFIFFSLIFPFSKVYFTTEKYGGCVSSTKANDILFSPLGHRIITLFWMLCSLCLVLNIAPVWSSLCILIMCRVFFIEMRWSTPMRGMGAPGFMSYWLAALIFFMEYSHYYGDVEGNLNALVIFAFQWDYGIMMMDSGFNKIMHGYPRSYGMNYGMANPAWSYWPNFFKKLPTRHILFQFMNYSAFFWQILGGFLMLIPQTRWIGGLIICLSFLLVKGLIRLGVLCDMLMLCTVICTAQNGWLHQALVDLNLFQNITPIAQANPVPIVNTLLTCFLITYIICLPLAKFGMYLNYYFRKRLPAFLQTILEKYTGFLGVILWRVFTIDLIDFFIRVSHENKETNVRTPYTRFGAWKLNSNNRFLWVGESIMSLIVFNTERYFPQLELFNTRLKRYARTMDCPKGSRVLFEYVLLKDCKTHTEFLTVKEYRVDVHGDNEIDVKVLDGKALEQQKLYNKRLTAATKPGSYAPSAK